MSNSPAGQPVRSMPSLNGETKLFIIIGEPFSLGHSDITHPTVPKSMRFHEPLLIGAPR